MCQHQHCAELKVVDILVETRLVGQATYRSIYWAIEIKVNENLLILILFTQ
jgi:hypothetical protein